MIRPTRVPRATYRLQLSGDLRLSDVRRLVSYLDDLGIGDAYPSPLFRAREGSSHGYDVIDHRTIHPDFGTSADFAALAEELRRQRMGLLIDVVPNHMGVDDPNNAWWQDVLENGMASQYATYFDIDWYPPKELLREKVLLPFLGDQFGRVLEEQQLTLRYDQGRLGIAYFDHRYPLDPGSQLPLFRRVLQRLDSRLDAADPQRMEWESIMTALSNLPSRRETDGERMRIRYREKEVIRRRIAALCEASPAIRHALDETVAEFNGRAGDPRSFDRLEALLADQAYRLCYWRVASDEINYRRFFDINALAAVRVESPEVFEAVHAMLFGFLDSGWVTGLRVDHPDGLLDPRGYFSNLQHRYRLLRPAPESSAVAVAAQADSAGAGEEVAEMELASEAEGGLYLTVEKILMPDERLPADWPVCGTTGYDFLNQLNALFVAPQGVAALRAIYQRFTGRTESFADVLYESKRVILGHSMSSELYVLAGQLDRISEQHRWSRDFTRSSLHRTLREVIACFPVYRTYFGPGAVEIRDEDRRRILVAIRAAKRRNPSLDSSLVDFLASVLLLQDPDGLGEADRQERRQFVLRFQQVTGPVMAKGMEDTAFYRYYPLASLNEVGGDPTAVGLPASQFHQRNRERQAAWPHAMSATATHDTKRGEDTRARLNVLSEIPKAWEQALRRWQTAHAERCLEVDGLPVPDAQDQYLLYQTLVATWPLAPAEPHGLESNESGAKREESAATEDYCRRIVEYMDKALKEAKRHTSWTDPSQEYSGAVGRFVRTILDRRTPGGFLKDLDRFVRSIADAGFTNSLAQTVLKICLPGVPDFYQGTELWDFSLVDPDNRRPVDFVRRQQLLDGLRAQAADDLPGLVAQLLACWPDERIKMYTLWRSLGLRRDHPAVFAHGAYLPWTPRGPRSDHVFAAAREDRGQWVLAVVPRFSAAAWRHAHLAAPGPAGWRFAAFASWWQETWLPVPVDSPTAWRHVLTGEWLAAEESPTGEQALRLGDLFARFPVAVLASA